MKKRYMILSLKVMLRGGKYKQYAKNCEVILIDIKDREFTTYTLYSGDKGVSDVSWVNNKPLPYLNAVFGGVRRWVKN